MRLFPKSRKNRADGFTLVELLISLGGISFAALAVMGVVHWVQIGVHDSQASLDATLLVNEMKAAMSTRHSCTANMMGVKLKAAGESQAPNQPEKIQKFDPKGLPQEVVAMLGKGTDDFKVKEIELIRDTALGGSTYLANLVVRMTKSAFLGASEFTRSIPIRVDIDGGQKVKSCVLTSDIEISVLVAGTPLPSTAGNPTLPAPTQSLEEICGAVSEGTMVYNTATARCEFPQTTGFKGDWQTASCGDGFKFATNDPWFNCDCNPPEDWEDNRPKTGYSNGNAGGATPYQPSSNAATGTCSCMYGNSIDNETEWTAVAQCIPK